MCSFLGSGFQPHVFNISILFWKFWVDPDRLWSVWPSLLQAACCICPSETPWPLGEPAECPVLSGEVITAGKVVVAIENYFTDASLCLGLLSSWTSRRENSTTLLERQRLSLGHYQVLLTIANKGQIMMQLATFSNYVLHSHCHLFVDSDKANKNTLQESTGEPWCVRRCPADVRTAGTKAWKRQRHCQLARHEGGALLPVQGGSGTQTCRCQAGWAHQGLWWKICPGSFTGEERSFKEEFDQCLFTQLVNLDSPKKALARVLSQHIVPTANLRSPQWCDASIPAGVKMAIILPTGQWYAPSAVINDAWYCMVLHCIA